MIIPQHHPLRIWICRVELHEINRSRGAQSKYNNKIVMLQVCFVLACSHWIATFIMTDHIQVEQLRSEVSILRRRVKELEAQAIEPERTASVFPHLEEPFTALFRASPVAVVITSANDERYIDVNEEFARITGYAREEVIGRRSHELHIWNNPEDRARIGRMFAEQPVIRDIELTFRTKAQALRTVIASLALINYEGLPCVLTMCHDITTLQQTAVERERLLLEAQAAIRLRDDFLSIAAHELKTPLTALQLYLEGMRRIARKQDPAETLLQRIVSRLDNADQQVDRLTKLINDLFDVTRIREGRLQLEVQALDLGQIAGAVVTQFEEQLEKAQCALTLDITPAPLITADQSRLEQIMTNLLANAIKYGPGQPIEVRVAGDTRSAWLAVRDYGIGIAPEDQQRIFERFERAVSTDNYGGLGLGLYVVQQLVAALNGTIEVESEPGRGATFTVTFPAINERSIT